MQVSVILTGVTVVPPTSSLKAFRGSLLSGLYDAVHLHHSKGGEGVEKGKSNR